MGRGLRQLASLISRRRLGVFCHASSSSFCIKESNVITFLFSQVCGRNVKLPVPKGKVLKPGAKIRNEFFEGYTTRRRSPNNTTTKSVFKLVNANKSRLIYHFCPFLLFHLFLTELSVYHCTMPNAVRWNSSSLWWTAGRFIYVAEHKIALVLSPTLFGRDHFLMIKNKGLVLPPRGYVCPPFSPLLCPRILLLLFIFSFFSFLLPQCLKRSKVLICRTMPVLMFASGNPITRTLGSLPPLLASVPCAQSYLSSPQNPHREHKRKRHSLWVSVSKRNVKGSP